MHIEKTAELIELLDTLRENGGKSSVVISDDSHAIIHMGKRQLRLTGEECKLLFNDDETVADFVETIFAPGSSNLELYGIDVTDSVKAELESYFSTVDEM